MIIRYEIKLEEVMTKMLTLMIVLVLTAFIAAIASAAGRCPLWVSVIVLCLIELIRVLPK